MQYLSGRAAFSTITVDLHQYVKVPPTPTPTPIATGEGEKTRIGDDNFIMNGVHIGHDTEIGSHCIIASHCALGGHVIVEDYAVIGGLCGIHQFARVGESVMVAAMSALVFAGSAQFIAVAMLQEGAAALAIVATGETPKLCFPRS